MIQAATYHDAERVIWMRSPADWLLRLVQLYRNTDDVQFGKTCTRDFFKDFTIG
jgi:hypothetical protein